MSRLGPSHGSSSRAVASRSTIVASLTPEKPRAISAAFSSAASMSSPSEGLIWIVASRAIWFSQTDAVSRTRVTAPSVRQDRKVMMAMTEISARPAMFCDGTIGAILRCARSLAGRALSTPCPSCGSASSVIDVEPPAGQDHAARIDLFHQAEIVGGDHHGGAEPVEFDEQPQKPARQRRIDITGRLIGEQYFGLLDQRPGD